MKKVNIITLLILVFGALVGILGAVVFANEPIIFIGLGIMFLSIVYHLIYYRCPHCHKYLYHNYGEFCQYCGEKINKD